MNDKSKIFKILIIIFIIIIVSIIITIVLLNKNNIPEEEKEYVFDENVETEKEPEEDENGFQMLDDSNVFFTIIDIISKYYNAVNYDGNSEISQEENIFDIQNEEQRQEVLNALLDKDYMSSNDISKIEKIEYDYNIIPIEIKTKYDENINTYITHIYIEDYTQKKLEEKYIIIRQDTENQTFSIEPIDDNIDNIDEVRVSDNKNKIIPNNYNNYEIKMFSVEALIRTYMSNFKNMCINYPEIAYNNYLDDEYKEKRFGNINELKRYMDKNKEEWENITASKYKVENEDDKEIYICLDQYNNSYQIEELATMQYKVKFDTYTIFTDKFKNTYNESNNRNKSLMSIDKWVEMLNRRDYKTAYEKLNETFKNNTFGSEEKFEQYMREKYQLHYNVQFEDFSEENNVYSVKVVLKDVLDENTKQEINVIIVLKDNYDFEMSFNIQQEDD